MQRTIEDNLKSAAQSQITHIKGKSSVNKAATENEPYSSIDKISNLDLRVSSFSTNPEHLIINPPTIYNLGEKVMLANYAVDEELQRIIKSIKQSNKTKIQKVPAPWREKLSILSLVNNGYIYMDDRLVVPKALRTGIEALFSLGAHLAW